MDLCFYLFIYDGDSSYRQVNEVNEFIKDDYYYYYLFYFYKDN